MKSGGMVGQMGNVAGFGRVVWRVAARSAAVRTSREFWLQIPRKCSQTGPASDRLDFVGGSYGRLQIPCKCREAGGPAIKSGTRIWRGVAKTNPWIPGQARGSRERRRRKTYMP